VYDITVQDNHNFIVSSTPQIANGSGVIVHNCQNIYSFNHTVNAFELYKGKATFFAMSQSFRVKDTIASRIENFACKYIDSSMTFKGIPISDTEIKTSAIITRTNAALVDYMIKLEKTGTPFSLVRRAADVYKLPLLACNFKHNSTINDPLYRHIQEDINHYFDYVQKEDIRNKQKSSVFSYLAGIYAHDFPLMQSIRLVTKHGAASIIRSYNHARSFENGTKRRQTLFLATSHSVKGLEFDSVTIGDDLNESTGEVVAKIKLDEDYVISTEDASALNLYYVACSRAKKELLNATLLDAYQQSALYF
jgi:hypothetical protein